jgi:hypothetical protein
MLLELWNSNFVKTISGVSKKERVIPVDALNLK